MTRVRRPAQSRHQGMTLLKVVLVLAASIGFTVVLFRLDAFPAKHGHTSLSFKKKPAMTPEKLLAAQDAAAAASQQQIQLEQQIRHKVLKEEEEEEERKDSGEEENEFHRGKKKNQQKNQNSPRSRQKKEIEREDEEMERRDGEDSRRSDNHLHREQGNHLPEEQRQMLRRHPENVQPVGASQPGGRVFEMKIRNLVGGQSSGSVIFETRPDWAPIGVEHFHKLVEAGYYDQCRFFRVVPQFIVQFGIAADPSVTEQWRSDVLKDDPVIETNRRGTITYATSGKDTRTTQLFINTKSTGNAFLDKQGFAPFAEILEGIQYVDMINGEYGEKPSQGKASNHGNIYLNEEFPRLTYIESVRWIRHGENMSNGGEQEAGQLVDGVGKEGGE